MIYETLEIIKDQVTNYLEAKLSESSLVVIDNIAKLEDPEATALIDKIVLSLLNLEEEVALKNVPNIKFKNGEHVYENNPISLNLYILFSGNRNLYTKSITALSAIIEFFQSKHLFHQHNTILNPTISALDPIKEFKFTVELYTPTFEQLNFIWGTLGGKSLPSLMYKISLVRIDSSVIHEKGTPIHEISGEVKPMN